MGRGGARAGAGRKKKPIHLRAIDGGAGRRGPQQDAASASTAIADPVHVEPPLDLSGAELVVWHELAPQAAAARTLTATTFANFIHLCQAEADRRELRARYSLRRLSGTGDLLPLLVMDSDEELSVRREHRALMKDITAMMKNFAIAPFGKEIQSPGAEPEADPLDAFTRKRG
jgi:hypothetical protein